MNAHTIASYWPCWYAAQFGDRDPEVLRQARLYQDHFEREAAL